MNEPSLTEKLDRAIAAVQAAIVDMRKGPIGFSRFTELMRAILPVGAEAEGVLDPLARDRADELFTLATKTVHKGVSDAMIHMETALMLMRDSVSKQRSN